MFPDCFPCVASLILACGMPICLVTMLANDLSRETRLQLMPGVENVQDELRKLEEEKNKEQEDFGVYKNFTKAFQGAADRTEAVTDEPEGT